MRLVIVTVVTLVAWASAAVVSPKGYHEDVGIPLAARIREQEAKAMAEKIVFNKDNEERIIGGVLAPANAYPHFGGLLIDMVNLNAQSVCGSALISSNRALTAAHCWFDGINQAWRFTVVLGTQFLHWDGLRLQTTTVVMHPQWTPANLLNDIAVIYLPTNVPLSTSIQPIALPTTFDMWDTFMGQWAQAVGFGKTADSQAGASAVLSHVSLQVISEDQCRSVYGSNFVFPSTLCTNGANGLGVCSGDSGGPLSINRNGRPLLVGVTSFAANNACEQGHPSGFARVTSFLGFINQHFW